MLLKKLKSLIRETRGEIATLLTLISVSLMLMGIVVGKVAVKQPIQTQSKAVECTDASAPAFSNLEWCIDRERTGKCLAESCRACLQTDTGDYYYICAAAPPKSTKSCSSLEVASGVCRSDCNPNTRKTDKGNCALDGKYNDDGTPMDCCVGKDTGAWIGEIAHCQDSDVFGSEAKNNNLLYAYELTEKGKYFPQPGNVFFPDLPARGAGVDDKELKDYCDVTPASSTSLKKQNESCGPSDVVAKCLPAPCSTSGIRETTGSSECEGTLRCCITSETPAPSVTQPSANLIPGEGEPCYYGKLCVSGLVCTNITGTDTFQVGICSRVNNPTKSTNVTPTTGTTGQTIPCTDNTPCTVSGTACNPITGKCTKACSADKPDCGSGLECDIFTGFCRTPQTSGPAKACTACNANRRCFWDAFIDPRSGRAPVGTLQCTDTGCVNDAECQSTASRTCKTNNQDCEKNSDCCTGVNAVGVTSNLICSSNKKCIPQPQPTPICNDFKTYDECIKPTNCGSKRGCEGIPYAGGFFDCWRCKTADFCSSIFDTSCTAGAGKPTPSLAPKNSNNSTNNPSSGQQGDCKINLPTNIVKNEKFKLNVTTESSTYTNARDVALKIDDVSKQTSEFFIDASSGVWNYKDISLSEGRHTFTFSVNCQVGGPCTQCGSNTISVGSSTSGSNSISSSSCNKLTYINPLPEKCANCLLQTQKAKDGIGTYDSANYNKCTPLDRVNYWCGDKKDDCKSAMDASECKSNTTPPTKLCYDESNNRFDYPKINTQAYSNEGFDSFIAGVKSGKYTAIDASLYVLNATRVPGLQRLFCDPFKGQCDFYFQNQRGQI